LLSFSPRCWSRKQPACRTRRSIFRRQRAVTPDPGASPHIAMCEFTRVRGCLTDRARWKV
jgi:hypothetical protein